MDTCSAINEDFFAFVAKHAGEDPLKLRLKFKPRAGDALDLAITHLQCLQKASKKFLSSIKFITQPTNKCYHF